MINWLFSQPSAEDDPSAVLWHHHSSNNHADPDRVQAPPSACVSASEVSRLWTSLLDLGIFYPLRLMHLATITGTTGSKHTILSLRQPFLKIG